jgi:hypothetical protein
MAVDAADTTYRHTALEEKGVRLKLTLVDTPGYGELVDNSHQCVRFTFFRLPSIWRALLLPYRAVGYAYTCQVICGCAALRVHVHSGMFAQNASSNLGKHERSNASTI